MKLLIKHNYFLLIFLMFTACGERKQHLFDDIYVVDLSGQTSAIIDNDGNFIVYPHVSYYTYIGDYILGVRELAGDNSDGSDNFTSELGYFKLDKRNMLLVQGLTKSECLKDIVCKKIL